MQGYIKKPVEVEQLIDRIKKHLGMNEFKILRELWGHEYDRMIAAVSPAIKKALHHIGQNYNNNFTRKRLAASLIISPDYLSRQFRKECELHLMEYLNFVRMHKSKELLRDSKSKIKDVASSVGIYYYGGPQLKRKRTCKGLELPFYIPGF